MKSKKISKKNNKGKQNKGNKNSVKKGKRNIKGGRRKKVNSKKKNNKRKDNKKKSKRKTKYSQKGGNSIIQIFVISWDDYEKLLKYGNFIEKIEWNDTVDYLAGKSSFNKNKGFDRTDRTDKSIHPKEGNASIKTDVVLCIEIKQNETTENLNNDLKSINEDIGRIENLKTLLKSETNNPPPNNPPPNSFKINGMVTVAHIDKLPIITMRGIMSKSGTGSARYMLQGIKNYYHSELEKTYQFNFPVWTMLKNFAINTNLHTTFYTKDFRIIKAAMIDTKKERDYPGSKTIKYQAVILSIATKFPKLIATNNEFTIKDKNDQPIIYVNHNKSTVKIDDIQTVNYDNFEDLLYTKMLAENEDTKQLANTNGLYLRGDVPIIFNLEDIEEGQNKKEIEFIENLLKQKGFLQGPFKNEKVPIILQGKVVSVPDFYQDIQDLDTFLKTFDEDSINKDVLDFYPYPTNIKDLKFINYFNNTIKPVKAVWKILKQIKDSREKINKIFKDNGINDIEYENIPTTLFSS